MLLLAGSLHAQVGINSDGSAPDGSAMLDVKSTEMGVLFPRLTKAQRDAIATPATGLIVFQTNDTTGFYYYTGSKWVVVSAEALSINDLLDGRTISSSVFLGSGAGVNDDGTDNWNVGLGDSALYSNISGAHNTGVGYQSLFSNTSGHSNTAYGYLSLQQNTTGEGNTGIGYGALYTCTIGNFNAVIGHKSLFKSTTGSYNTASGYMSLYNNTTGSFNTGIGYWANYNNQEGNNNTTVGYEAGKGASIHNKSGNIFLGYQAGFNETGDDKLYIENSNSSIPLIWGDFANDSVRINGTLDINNAFAFPTVDGISGQILQTNGSGTLSWADNSGATALQWSDTTNQLATDYDVSLKQDIADTSTVDATRYWVGQQGYLSTVAIDSLTDGKSDGSSVFLGSGAGVNDAGPNNKNVAVGIDALNTNSSGFENTASGYQALYSNTTGYKNIAIGYKALYSNTTGFYNTANGYEALTSNTTGRMNTASGCGALYSNTTGFYNTAYGHIALNENTSGDNNTATGFWALNSNTEGNRNTANGGFALSSNSTGNYNTASGFEALNSNTTGSGNTANGYQALKSNTTGGANVAAGYGALADNMDGDNNTAIGVGALGSNTTGNENTSFGHWASYYNTTGNYNVGIGKSSNFYNQEGSKNTIIGYEAGKGASTHNKSGNVFLGYKAGFNEIGDNKLYIENSNSSTPLIWGDFENDTVRINGTLNVAGKYSFPGSDGSSGHIIQTDGSGNLSWIANPGSTALQWSDTTNQLATDYDVSIKQDIIDTSTVDATRFWVGQQGYLSTVSIDSLTDGRVAGSSIFLGSFAGFSDDGTNNQNVGIGTSALRNNTSGWHNVAVGRLAMFSNTTGRDNTSSGYYAFYNNTTGWYNSAFGSEALYSNTTANGNSAFGRQSLYSNNTGASNTGIGHSALHSNTSGSYNTVVGHSADRYNETGSNNTILGYQAGGGSTAPHSKSGNIFIGYKAGFLETGDNKLYIENSTSSSPLIWGDFANDSVRINGTLEIYDAFAFPTVDGSTGQILQTDGSGSLSWIANPGSTALQWSDTTNQLATDYNVSMKQNISDTSSVDATRHWVGQQGYLSTVAIDSLTDGKTGGNSVFLGSGAGNGDDGSDRKNIAIGFEALYQSVTGFQNVATGYQALKWNTGSKNTVYGFQSAYKNTTGTSNTAVGYMANLYNETGSNNIAIGYEAGMGSTVHNKSGGVYLGYQAGKFEMSDNKLYIENSGLSTPLIYGKFDEDLVAIYGNLGIGDTAFGYGSRTLALFNGTAPTNSVTDGILLYAEDVTTSELKVRDESGVVTTLSPHNFSMIQKSEPMAWSFYSENHQTGQKINVDMLRVVRLLEQISGEKLAHIQDIADDVSALQDEPEMRGIIQHQQEMIEALQKENQVLKETLQTQNQALLERLERLEKRN